MIYLIDDKKLRQESDYGWTTERLEILKDIICPIYELEDIELRAEEIFHDNNTVLYHESFLDNSKITSQSHIKRKKLEQYAQKQSSFQLVFFSGSKNSRIISGNVAHLPVSIVYQNLSIFIEKYSKNERDLRYLAFGENPEIESELLEKLEIAQAKIEQDPVIIDGQSCLFIPTLEKYIQNPIKDATIIDFLDQESDYEITEFIYQNLSKVKYDNIFIPLCYGNSLSDFNGLRLATHIRCTATLNQLSRIIIYGFVGIDYLLQNDYFNILKTKNILLVPYTKIDFKKIAETTPSSLTIDELPIQIAKLHLEIPPNYESNHSLANEWSIYRWALTIEANDDDIDKITQNVNHQIYFKYLQTLYPKSGVKLLTKKQLEIKYSGSPKLLYIDDDADKGWHEIFRKMLHDINGLSFELISHGFNSNNEEAIINESIEKIKKDEIDLVILDLRLHPNDLRINNIEKFTGYNLLKKIKALNPGIQVIVFSATNKVWNLQVLQETGADGFIAKGSPDNNLGSDFTIKTIEHFVAVLEKCLMKQFLKEFFLRFDTLKHQLIPRKNKKSANPLPKDFVDETLKWYELSCAILNKDFCQSMMTASFIFMFSVLENVSNRLINVETPIPVENTDPQKFMFEFRSSPQKLKRFQEDENNAGYFRRTNSQLKTTRHIPWLYKILNTMDFITGNKLNEDELCAIIKKRNDLIHANVTTGDKIDINTDLLIQLNHIIYNGLINVK